MASSPGSRARRVRGGLLLIAAAVIAGILKLAGVSVGTLALVLGLAAAAFIVTAFIATHRAHYFELSHLDLWGKRYRDVRDVLADIEEFLPPAERVHSPIHRSERSWWRDLLATQFGTAAPERTAEAHLSEWRLSGRLGNGRAFWLEPPRTLAVACARSGSFRIHADYDGGPYPLAEQSLAPFCEEHALGFEQIATLAEQVFERRTRALELADGWLLAHGSASDPEFHPRLFSTILERLDALARALEHRSGPESTLAGDDLTASV
ncbi:MAG: hypothetical protein IPI67_03460 [Myxococcales bacterium]|nr:hypothetical protein [Myxococcales bacterium]